MQFYLIVALVFALLVAIFAIQNTAYVTLVFFTLQFEVSLVVIVLGSLAAGALITGLLGFLPQLRMRLELKKLKSHLEALKAKSEELKEENEKLKESLENSTRGIEEDKNLETEKQNIETLKPEGEEEEV